MDFSFLQVVNNLCQLLVEKGFTDAVQNSPFQHRDLIHDLFYLFKGKISVLLYHATKLKTGLAPEVTPVRDLQV